MTEGRNRKRNSSVVKSRKKGKGKGNSRNSISVGERTPSKNRSRTPSKLNCSTVSRKKRKSIGASYSKMEKRPSSKKNPQEKEH